MRMPERPLMERADNVYRDTYHEVLGGLNRTERRTAKGKLRVAEAEIAALKAQNEFLRMHMEEQL